MNLAQLQTRLAALVDQGGHPVYAGNCDGRPDAPTKAGIIEALTIGTDNSVMPVDLKIAADNLGVNVAKIRTISAVETTGDAYSEGRPVILFEGHRFSKATGGAYDRDHPSISYPAWDASKYPRLQSARYQQLVEAVCLDVDAGFASASYGGFQILGENYARCGYASPWSFAWAQSQSEGDQLAAFVAFVKSDAVLLNALRIADWATVARRYNGSAYAKNRYDQKLAARYEIERKLP